MGFTVSMNDVAAGESACCASIAGAAPPNVTANRATTTFLITNDPDMRQPLRTSNQPCS
jgi:hypothetical protein